MRYLLQLNFQKNLVDEKGTKYKICIAFCGFTNYELSKYSKIINIPCLDGSNIFSENWIFISDLEQMKGFEFNEVIILNCNKGVLPPDDFAPEEAFRIGCKLYVAMTRAKDRLFLSYSKSPGEWMLKLKGLVKETSWDNYLDKDSHFIYDLPEKLPEIINNDDQSDAAILELTGIKFLYTKYAIGVDKRLLDFLEFTVIGVMKFEKKSNISLRTNGKPSSTFSRFKSKFNN